MDAIGRTPVQHLSPAGIPSADHVSGAPCVEVLFTFSPIAPGGGTVLFEGRCWALIDTGADISAIDIALIPPQAERDVAISEITVNGEALVQIYRLNLLFAGTIKSFHTQVAGVRLSPNRPYRMVIGRQMLANTRFVYDRERGIMSLDVF